MVYKEKNLLILIALLIAGIVIGGVLGDYVGQNKDLKIFAESFKLGSDNQVWKLDLGIFKLYLGFLLKLNLGSAIGIVAAILLYKKV